MSAGATVRDRSSGLPAPVVWGALGLIGVLAFWFRLHDLVRTPPGLFPDEAINGIDALRSLAAGRFQAFYDANFGREGLLIWLQALSLDWFGVSPYALRFPVAVVGSLSVLLMFFATKESLLFLGEPEMTVAWAEEAALLTAFLLATSMWHITFSRVGMRMILAVFFPPAAIWAMIRGLQRRSCFSMVVAGAVTGAGLYGYPTYRFFVFPLLVIVIFDGWRRSGSLRRGLLDQLRNARLWLFAVVAAGVASPLLKLAITRPEKFIERTRMIFVTSVPDFLVSARATALMLTNRGDASWLHNISKWPALSGALSVCFGVGLLLLLASLVAGSPEPRTGVLVPFLVRYSSIPYALFLLTWLFVMLLPGALTNFVRPNFGRTVGATAPVYTIVALGALLLLRLLAAIPHRRLSTVVPAIVLALGMLLMARATYRNYFQFWTHYYWTQYFYHWPTREVARRLNALPDKAEKYVVIIRNSSVDPADSWNVQPVEFLTGTYTEEGRARKHLRYLDPPTLKKLVPEGPHPVFFLVEVQDKEAPQIEAAIRQVAPAARIIRPEIPKS